MDRRPQNNWDSYRHPSMDYKPPKQLQRFRATMAVLISAVIVGGVWTGGWFAAMTYVRGQVKDFIAAEAARGATVGYDVLDVSGYPARINVTLTTPRYKGVVRDVPVTWQGETLTVTTRPWWPFTVRVAAPGRHDLTMGEPKLSLKGAAQDLVGEVSLGQAWPETLALDVTNLVLNGDASVIVGALSVAMEHDAKVTAGGDGLRLNVTADTVTLPLNGGGGLGDTLSTVDLALRVTGPVHPGPVWQSLETWRSVGGAVEVERLRARMGPLAIVASGTMALDEQLQPEGAFTAKIEGLFQVLELLRRRGVIRDADAIVASMALSALAKRPPDGGPANINLAVSVQNGKLGLGSVPIFEVPTLDWGKPAAPVDQTADQAAPPRDYKAGPQVY